MWVISHIIVTPIRHSISEGKIEHIDNFYIIPFTIYSNGNFKYSNMSIWVKILYTLKIVKWLMIRFVWW